MKLRTIKTDDACYDGVTVIDFEIRFFEYNPETEREDVPVTLGLTPNGTWIAITVDGGVDCAVLPENERHEKLIEQGTMILFQMAASKL